MLERIKLAKADEILALEVLESVGGMPAPYMGARPSFADAVRSNGHIKVIAEYKRKSPSEGVIEENISPIVAGTQYAAAGADAISVLTEELHFDGRMEYLRMMSGVGMPMLRKDFIFDSLQVRATAATPASALLLIVKLTKDSDALRCLREEAESYGMDAVVEITDEYDLDLARLSGARIIQVNSRDLYTMQVNQSASLRLCALRQPGEIWISASGISESKHIELARVAGFDAVLVGTTLMRGGQPGNALRRLLEPVRSAGRLRVKVCGMMCQQDLDAAAACGVDMVGFIFASESKRYIPPEFVNTLMTPTPVLRVGVFVDSSVSQMIEIARVARLDMVQMHGVYRPEQMQKIREQIPAIRVLWPERRNANGTPMDLASTMSKNFVGMHLLDAGQGNGGMGNPLDWKKLKVVPHNVPWFLAGGLTPDNVVQALTQCTPYGIDLNSGIEDEPGVKNAEKMRAAIELARRTREEQM